MLPENLHFKNYCDQYHSGSDRTHLYCKGLLWKFYEGSYFYGIAGQSGRWRELLYGRDPFLKRILEECEKPEPVLCIVDEVLRGTNTIERIAASSQILHSLAKPKVLAMAATHDIELSYVLKKSMITIILRKRFRKMMWYLTINSAPAEP